MSTSLFVKVNEEIYEKYQDILDVKGLVSSTRTTHNFINGALLKIAVPLFTNDNESIERFIKVGKEVAGENELKYIYLPSSYIYEDLFFRSSFTEMADKEDFFRGCLAYEIRKQHKLFCRGRSHR